MELLGVTEEQRTRRNKLVLFLRYLLFATAGLLLVIYPLRVVLETIAAGYTYAGGGLLLLGSGLAAVGVAADRWSGEALGLPLVFIAFALFGAVLLFADTLAGIAVGLIFLGVALGVASRWFNVMYLLKLAKLATNGDPDGR